MRIAIIGAGKMGSWLARHLAQNHEVGAFDLDPFKARGMPRVKPLGSASELAAFSPELLVNAVSIERTAEAFEWAMPHLPQGCMIADVASVKGGLPQFYASCKRRFVSVHPMFGPTFTDMEMLKEENAVIIRESDRQGAAFFREFFSSMGLRIFDYTFAEHDQMMAYSLTTPFISSLVFAACLDKTVAPGATFARHMRIARGLLSEDDSLVCEVLFNPGSIKQIEKMTSKLEYLKHIIRARDAAAARDMLSKLRRNLER